ncbi:hypothetical protein [Alkalimarinus coralli]|uniref:hypothetical protein n=1 Tax=Alkalimarinus coralli TaxID=2935863 RepID=UPI00202B1DB8|nr:hypothetical protein [Alkalimarinus coralli]
MRGPKQAVIVAVIAAALPLMFWLSAAVLTLVTLRKGVGQGTNILVWASLPAIAWWIKLGDPGIVLVLILSWVMAVALRQTVSWEKMLIAGVLVAFTTGLLLPVMLPEVVQQLIDMAKDVYRQIDPEMVKQLSGELEPAFTSLMVGSLATTYLAIALGAVMLARSWQSSLYNPGGFRQEFHGFKLSPVFSLSAVGLTLFGPAISLNIVLLVLIILVPLTLAGIALVHGSVAKRNLGGHWLFVFYMSALLLGPSLFLLIIFMAILDSWFDFRGRINNSEIDQ